jgi:hypothetical protein
LPNYWIVKISLLEQSQYLYSLMQQTGKQNANYAVEFIKQSQKNGRSTFQMKVLEYLIESKRVVVIIDAFDEICPKYRDTTLQIIANLKSSNIPFAVSTRPQELEQIQKKIECNEHFELLAIEDLQEFFKQYFILKEKFDADEAKNKAENLTQFSNDAYKFGRVESQSFWRIPLHALMVAELYAKCASSVTMNNIHGLFEQFVEKRICRDLVEKLNLNPFHPKQSEDFEKRKKNILESLMHLAMRENFSEYQERDVDQLAAILREHERDINYTGIAVVNATTVQFSHHTFAEYLSIKFCLLNLQDSRVLEVMKQILVDSTHWTKRKFLNEMVAIKACPALGRLLQEKSGEVLVRICKENLVEIFRLLVRSRVKFVYDKPQRVVQSQDVSLWEAFDLHSPSKRARTDYDDDDDDDDEYYGHITTFPLSLAIASASENLVLMLINDGADLWRLLYNPLSNYEDILSHAIMRNMPKVVKQILAIRPLKEEQDYEELCMLHWAVRANNLELVQILYEAGASISAFDENGKTPLDATKDGRTNQQIIKFLNEHLALAQAPVEMDD